MLDFYVIPALYLGAFQQDTWIIHASFSPLEKKNKITNATLFCPLLTDEQ